MRRTVRRGASAIVLAAVALCGGPALADDRPCGAQPWVLVTGSVGGVTDAEFLGLLRAELGPHRIDACTAGAPGAPSPIATVALSPREGRVAIDVEVRDAVTAKRVSREIDLTSIPPDGRAFALASAIDELLQASWAELALPSAPPPPQPVPNQVRERVETTLHPPAAAHRRVATLGLALGLEHYAGGQSLVGPDLRSALAVSPRVALDLHLGYRTGLTVAAPDGDVRSSALLFGAGGAWSLTPPSAQLGLDALVRFDVARVSFFASATSGAIASSGTETAVLGALGPRGWLRIGAAWRLALDVLVVAPFRPARATDNGAVVTSVSGAGIAAALSVEGDL